MRPEGWNLIRTGKKIYEYRKRFIKNEKVTAFLYLSRPVSAISGIIYMDEAIELSDWKNKYHDDVCLTNRIESYLSRGNKVVMPVISYQETSKIEADYIKKKLGRFTVPQGFYYLENSELLELLNKELVLQPEIRNPHNLFDSKNEICKDYGLRMK